MDVRPDRSSPVFRGDESHAVKIINLKTNRIASPPHLAAVHIDRVDQVDFFGWTDDGVVAMPARDHIPQLTVVQLRSQGVNLQSLRESHFTACLSMPRSYGDGDQDPAIDARAAMLARHLDVPKNRDALAEWADRWTSGVPRGWRQVEAIVQRLRSDFQVDPAATAPATCDDVVTHFLQTGRGPDYLFATTAAMLLRAQGYPSRLVTGFYARPDRFDRRAAQTAILAQDVHVWAEVHVGGCTWIPIEPTPGYAPPREALTWQQRLSLAWRTAWRWCQAHAGTLAAIAGVAVAIWATRIVWLDHIFALYCGFAGWGSMRRRVLWTARLLDWRARLAGCARPGPTTLSAWHGSLAAVLPSETSACLRFALQAAEKVLYGTPEALVFGAASEEVSRACRVVQRRVGIRCFRAAFHTSRTSVPLLGNGRNRAAVGNSFQEAPA
jgi:hypothetical protein